MQTPIWGILNSKQVIQRTNFMFEHEKCTEVRTSVISYMAMAMVVSSEVSSYEKKQTQNSFLKAMPWNRQANIISVLHFKGVMNWDTKIPSIVWFHVIVL